MQRLLLTTISLLFTLFTLAQTDSTVNVVNEKGFLKRKTALSVMKISRDSLKYFLDNVNGFKGLMLTPFYNSRACLNDQVTLEGYMVVDGNSRTVPVALVEEKHKRSTVRVDKNWAVFNLTASQIKKIVEKVASGQYVYFVPVLYPDHKFVRYQIAKEPEIRSMDARSDTKRSFELVETLDPSPPAPPRYDSTENQ